MKKILPILLTLVLVFSQASGVLALPKNSGNAYDDTYDKLTSQEQKKKELEAKIRALQAQENTLANQMAYLDSQISLTLIQQEEAHTKIEETQRLLEGVNDDIDELSGKLENLDSSIGDLHKVLASRIRLSYQLEVTGGDVLLNSQNAQDVVKHLAYLKSLQKEDKRLLEKMNGTRDVYAVKKEKLEGLKTEKEELKAQLVEQKSALEAQEVALQQQQASKAWLIGVTQNEEAKYQRLVAEVEEEIRSIRNALANLGAKIGSVKQGDVIAHLGNTGCSTGPHLHFGYYVNGVAVDPKPLLDNGTFIWPVNDPVVTQWFNDPDTRSWYQANFGMPGHNGIDIFDGTVGYGAPILAAADGIAYKVSDSQACWMTGTVGKGIRIDHPDGTKTIYWHVQ